MIISRTPFRISLFGGGSDFPFWFEENGGHVVSLTIDKFCYITVRILPPFFEHNFRIAYSQVETVKYFSDIQHPVVRESIRKYCPDLNLEVHHDGDLPARSGIGSSSAFAVGMINSLLSLTGKLRNNSELADLAIELEQDVLKENVGWQDQIACSVGGINFIQFGPGKNWKCSPIALTTEQESEICERIVLVFTASNRNSSDINAGLVESTRNKASQIRRTMELANDCKDILNFPKDYDLIGHMLNEGWQLKKSINPYAVTPSLETWYRRGIEAGALGGKVLGAGGGGFMLFWVKKNGREEFLRNFGNATVVPITINHFGSQIIYRSGLD